MQTKGNDGNDHLTGCISLQEIMNFTYTVIEPPDGQYGALQPDGTWNGIVKLLANQDIDIGTTTFAVTQERSTVITFASPLFEVYYSLFIKNPAEIFNIMAYIELPEPNVSLHILNYALSLKNSKNKIIF